MKGVFPLKIVGPERVMVAGMFTTVGSGNPTAIRGRGFSVAREAAGRYTVTLASTVNAIDSIVATVATETVATELVATIDQDSIDTNSFEINVSNLSGTLTDDAGSMVSFQAVCRTINVSDPQP